MAISCSRTLLPAVLLVALPCGCFQPGGFATSARPGHYLLCFWNVENLFDDRVDGRTGPDREYDLWFANDQRALDLKLAHLSQALLSLNGGRGPDIIAVAEVESLRAAELLRDALNRRLRNPSLEYQHVLMKEVHGGRHIAPAIITRLPVRGDRTQLHGRQLRILEGHVLVNGHDLVVIASHWTSRVSDKDSGHRDKYGDEIYGLFRAMSHRNPAVDFIVCGDFNDPPEAESVTRHLHATGAFNAVERDGSPPLLLDLFAGKDPRQFGTHYYHEHWYIFDQIVVSPGMLDPAGWSCDPDSAWTMNTLFRPGDRHRRPWPFGNERTRAERGYSDHFPVTVDLQVQGSE
jgi:endonuclease/exonuclease/phosphatase family metal-dependent hydrolase